MARIAGQGCPHLAVMTSCPFLSETHEPLPILRSQRAESGCRGDIPSCWRGKYRLGAESSALAAVISKRRKTGSLAASATIVVKYDERWPVGHSLVQSIGRC